MKRVLMYYVLACVAAVGMALTVEAGYKILHKIDKPTSGLAATSIIRLVKGADTFCSGTVLNDHTILTAFHCAVYAMGQPVEIRLFDDSLTGIYAVFKFGSASTDVALLTGDFSAFAPATYEADPNYLITIQKKGHKVKLCGFPYGNKLFCNTGVFVEPVGFGMLTTAIAIPGMSGGPAIDEYGDVIGVVSAVEANGSHSIFIPIYNLEERIQ